VNHASSATTMTARIMNTTMRCAPARLAFFGDKYGDEVRVLSMASLDRAVRRTHVRRTGDIAFQDRVGVRRGGRDPPHRA